MGGATNIGHFLDRFGPNGANIRLAGLCDEAEVHVFQRGLARAGLGDAQTLAELESRHFFVCAADLEDELIRALGAATVEQILDANGDLTAFRTFQQQPAQQGRSTAAHLRRFMGTRGGRKIHYAPVLARALRADQVPRPLAQTARRGVTRPAPRINRRPGYSCVGMHQIATTEAGRVQTTQARKQRRQRQRHRRRSADWHDGSDDRQAHPNRTPPHGGARRSGDSFSHCGRGPSCPVADSVAGTAADSLDAEHRLQDSVDDPGASTVVHAVFGD